ncbi:class I SAM-dependent methyltransferase [Sphingomonas prati]|uniref:SAM-dependent methyltransferase n=1 Tax=Sphingomonas prati TaxID=1843237 RepID=A0A7W9BUT5_9SPHN|nr:methyltransferase domain-containing protein [Sphingomonas prati]MBB5730515.1 SAM-dependent methyltransferase [Sphingomonas prati]GGE94637.1 methyltransferase type 11 [Sphingomonas prati]
MSDLAGDLPAGAFEKQDRGDDLAFYAPPRLVTHIDEQAVAALFAYYGATLPSGGVVLDLMSSWVSHLPDDLPIEEVIGHGMNAVELAANPRLDRWFVADLNAAPVLPLEDASVDGALCCVGVQYLQQPVAVFSEVRRVLRPGGRFVVSFSNRCFPTKAVRIWQALDMGGQAELIALYMARGGFSASEQVVLADGRAGDPLVVVTGTVA